MSENTNIQWADHTGGPWLICGEVSPGCLNCYARELMLSRLGNIVRAAYRKAGFVDWETRKIWGKDAPRVLSKGFWNDVRRINAKHKKAGTKGKWFPSMIDFLDEMPAGIISQGGALLNQDEVFGEFLEVIFECQNIDFLLLTKRPENWMDRTGLVMETTSDTHKQTREWLHGWRHGKPPDNIWIGTSVEDQKRADERIHELLKIPAKVRFLSAEPMLGPIDLSEGLWKSGCDPHCGDKCSKDADCPFEPLNQIQWVIFGGESGPGARQCNVDWIRDGVNQCRAAGVAPFVKQLGSDPRHDYDGQMVGQSGPLKEFKADVRIKNGPLKLKDKKGGDMSEWPEDLRVREFPKVI